MTLSVREVRALSVAVKRLLLWFVAPVVTLVLLYAVLTWTIAYFVPAYRR